MAMNMKKKRESGMSFSAGMLFIVTLSLIALWCYAGEENASLSELRNCLLIPICVTIFFSAICFLGWRYGKGSNKNKVRVKKAFAKALVEQFVAVDMNNIRTCYNSFNDSWICEVDDVVGREIFGRIRLFTGNAFVFVCAFNFDGTKHKAFTCSYSLEEIDSFSQEPLDEDETVEVLE
jgi:hypothetical protein